LTYNKENNRLKIKQRAEMLHTNLNISKYRFKLEAIDNITLPAYKGSTFHGGFGHALKKISPTWCQYFYEPGAEKKGNWPKPFVILPPLDEADHYSKGQQFYCELTLFGEATQHYAIAQSAIEYLGTEMGLGYTQGKYKIINIVETSPSEEISNKLQTDNNVTLYFPTRLRLKTNNKLCRGIPNFELLMARLLGRLKTLEKAYMGAELDSDVQHHLITIAKDISIKKHNIQWDDWDRFSGRHKQWMKFGGLVGSISYHGDLQPFIKILELGQWLHIGNKTSFGLGKYELKLE
jgi:hypothetical protein